MLPLACILRARGDHRSRDENRTESCPHPTCALSHFYCLQNTSELPTFMGGASGRPTHRCSRATVSRCLVLRKSQGRAAPKSCKRTSRKTVRKVHVRCREATPGGAFVSRGVNFQSSSRHYADCPFGVKRILRAVRRKCDESVRFAHSSCRARTCAHLGIAFVDDDFGLRSNSCFIANFRVLGTFVRTPLQSGTNVSQNGIPCEAKAA